ncbi:ABC transporter permease [Vineibacter terrae]|uniref:ABC transporter permease n=1 Tax=Vineibacter terrae TaxID=2586908 RepID=A0A5C8PTH1_9HYPH|nr:ABC transporter permease [Vineibacter terrae]TXL80283.1 ABC transporter permease [Vineibacter terrae]
MSAGFLLRRLGHGIVVVLGVTIVVFIVTRMVGDPVRVMLPIDASDEQRQAFAHHLGLDRPLPAQFADFFAKLARFDFGESLWQRRPAIDIVLERLPATLELVLVGMALALLLAIPLGVIAALRPGRGWDRATVSLSLLGLSLPQFWLGLLLIILFAVEWGLLPTSGRGTPGHLILPALTLALPATGRLAMIARSSMIDELNQPYVQTAIAKGLPLRRVVGLHALRNAANPVLTLAGWELIRSLAGYAVVVETVFAWPGLGYVAIQAIQRQDLVLLQTVVFVVAIMVVAINLAMDLVYKAIDPRIQLE